MTTKYIDIQLTSVQPKSSLTGFIKNLESLPQVKSVIVPSVEYAGNKTSEHDVKVSKLRLELVPMLHNMALHFMAQVAKYSKVYWVQPVSTNKHPVPQYGIGIDNAGEAEVWGLELDTTWLVTDNVRLQLGYAYLDAEYTEVVVERRSIDKD